MNKSNDYSFILKFPSKSEFNIKLYLNWNNIFIWNLNSNLKFAKINHYIIRSYKNVPFY